MRIKDLRALGTQLVPEWALPVKEMHAQAALETTPLSKPKRTAAPDRRGEGLITLERIVEDVRRQWGNREKPKPYKVEYPVVRVRKNQKDWTEREWQAFKDAINALREGEVSPTYEEFVDLHVRAFLPEGAPWGVHHARNFLAWHREYLARLEERLMVINPLVTIPYWNWIEDRYIPPPLTDPADLVRWGITRRANFDPSPIARDLDPVMGQRTFVLFQSTLERAPYHDTVHNQVGGTMSQRNSPKDPLFWLHHAFIDKVWADWQQTEFAEDPPNPEEVLQPPDIITSRVSEVVDTLNLGYIYG